MHTTHIGDVSFVHNGDYSGEIFIVGKDRDGKESHVVVTLSDVKGFLMSFVRQKLTNVIENADYDELVKITMLLGVRFLEVE
jgi:hypothetical protein